MEKGEKGVVYFSLGTLVNTSSLPAFAMTAVMEAVKQTLDYHFILAVDKYDQVSFLHIGAIVLVPFKIKVQQNLKQVFGRKLLMLTYFFQNLLTYFSKQIGKCQEKFGNLRSHAAISSTGGRKKATFRCKIFGDFL